MHIGSAASPRIGGPAEAVPDPEWERLLALVAGAGLADGTPQVAERLAQRLGPVGERDPLVCCLESLRVTLAGALRRRPPGPHDDDEDARQIGATRARGGLTLPEMLQRELVHQGLVGELLTDEVASREVQVEPGLLLELLMLLQDWTAWFMMALTSGHREAEEELRRQGDAWHDELVRRLLSGTSSAAAPDVEIERYGLTHTHRYHAFRARSRPGTSEKALLEELRPVASSGRLTGLAAVVDGEVWGFTSADVSPAVGCLVGWSDPVALEALGPAFQQATRALDVAELLGMSGPVNLRDVGVYSVVQRDHDVSAVLDARCVAPVLALGAGGDLVLSTVHHYIDSGCRLEATSQRLGLHPNTVRYRLVQYERATGGRLKDTGFLVETWWALAALRLERGSVDR